MYSLLCYRSGFEVAVYCSVLTVYCSVLNASCSVAPVLTYVAAGLH